MLDQGQDEHASEIPFFLRQRPRHRLPSLEEGGRTGLRIRVFLVLACLVGLASTAHALFPGAPKLVPSEARATALRNPLVTPPTALSVTPGDAYVVGGSSTAACPDRTAEPIGVMERASLPYRKSAARDPGKTVMSKSWADLHAGRISRALQGFQAVLDCAPNNVPALLGAAQAHRLHRDFSGAEAYLQRALDVSPENPETVRAMVSLITVTRPLSECLPVLKKLAETAPRSAPVAAQIAMAYAEAGDKAAASRHFRRAVTLVPENAPYVYNLAVLEDHLGRRMSARDLYRRTLALIEKAGPEVLPATAGEIERRVARLEGMRNGEGGG